jgi:hypothetical protein
MVPYRLPLSNSYLPISTKSALLERREERVELGQQRLEVADHRPLKLIKASRFER